MPRPPLPHEFLRPVPSFTLHSDDVPDGGTLSQAQVLAGGDLSPQLRWEGFPAETRSFAVTCFDPDAPTGCGWWHWVLFDLPADVTALPAGVGSGDFPGLPAGAIHARNDYGSKNFGGAAPPAGHGPHRYAFTVHALSVDKLGLDADTSPAAVSGTLGFLAVGRASIIATYENE
ncbi:Raf kinase inhibitor-like YbhB/YbcL family protein [Kitasatospora sp. MAP12-15]|uniref:YbhB/YbcL family Raf kinase inhibitor-like protein n=1 Tax=unclassified Kitasatospora TaxID=2633591 RepID=UPI002474424F|nr:YbhB/YbcL family Raf kinase inhibitor-like protein [Kitasatospora sp. MAP12-44]MDH6109031.1 Raf kinase inhibitor-like YbhB/YbcL family protein [Kitasatospora sp. MAP12-44]